MLRRLLGLSALLLLLAACTQPGAPAVTATLTPAANATGVDVNTVVSAEFSAPMSATTIVEGAFTLTSEAGPVAGEVEYVASEQRATFTPDEALAYGTEYTATLAGTVRSEAGGHVTGTTSGALSWSFTTEEEPVDEADVTAVTVTPPTLALLVDQSGQLTADVEATGDADESVTWTTSAPAVATVSNTGVVTAVGAGTATITATSVFNPAVSDSATVTVTVPVTPGVLSVSVSPESVTMGVGDDVELEAAVVAVGGADESVTWASNNEAVATVVDGVVTAVAPGTAVITVTSVFDDTLSADATVNVAGVTGLSVTPGSAELAVGGEATFTVAVATEHGADDSVTWTSSDDSVATVVDGVVTGVDAGTATITATSAYDLTYSDSATVTVYGPLVVASHYVTTPTGLEAGGAPINEPLGVSGGSGTYSYALTTTPPAGFPEDYEDVPYDDLDEIVPPESGIEFRLPPGDIDVDPATGALTGTHSPEDHGFYIFFIEVSDTVGQTQYIFVELELDEPFTLTYLNAEYTYALGCGAIGGVNCLPTSGGGTTFTTGFGQNTQYYRSIFPVADVVVSGNNAPVTFSMVLQTSGLNDGRWAINPANGVIGRRNGGSGNTNSSSNSDRTYVVTATEGGTGRTATFTIEFLVD